MGFSLICCVIVLSDYDKEILLAGISVGCANLLTNMVF